MQGAFSSLFYQNKFFYSMLIIIISFIFSAIFSTLALGISPWIRNRYLTFIFPFFFYIISGTIFEYIFQITKLNRYFSLNAINLFDLNPIASKANIIIYQVILFLIGISLFYFGVMYKDEKNI